MEIERKWLLTEVPEVVLKNGKEKFIYAGYISPFPQTRISKIVSGDEVKFKMTIKEGIALSRPEIEFPIPEKSFYDLVEDIMQGVLFTKKKYTLEGFSEFPIEVNIVDEDKETSFIYAEIEYPTEEAAANTPIPEWLQNAKEVTGQPYYYMVNYFFRNTGSGLIMKEEYNWDGILVTDAKKRYSSVIKLQETQLQHSLRHVELARCELTKIPRVNGMSLRPGVEKMTMDVLGNIYPPPELPNIINDVDNSGIPFPTVHCPNNACIDKNGNLVPSLEPLLTIRNEEQGNDETD